MPKRRVTSPPGTAAKSVSGVAAAVSRRKVIRSAISLKYSIKSCAEPAGTERPRRRRSRATSHRLGRAGWRECGGRRRLRHRSRRSQASTQTRVPGQPGQDILGASPTSESGILRRRPGPSARRVLDLNREFRRRRPAVPVGQLARIAWGPFASAPAGSIAKAAQQRVFPSGKAAAISGRRMP